MTDSFGPKCHRCVFFCSEGYHCLDLVSGHVHVSHHVTFAENIFPFSERQQLDPNSPTMSISPSRHNHLPFFHPPTYPAKPAESSTAVADPAATSSVITSVPVEENPLHSITTDLLPPQSSPPSPASASSAAPDASTTSSPTPPAHAIPVPAPTNDHTMCTRAKSVFRLPAKDCLNLHASLSPSSLLKSYKLALLDHNRVTAMKVNMMPFCRITRGS